MSASVNGMLLSLAAAFIMFLPLSAFSLLYLSRPTLLASVARQHHLLPWEEQCWHHTHYAIPSNGAERVAFFSNCSETTGRSSLHICPERVCVCLCVCVTAVVREYASKQVCMFMSDTITRKRESNKEPKRVREKYCSNPRAECCSSGEMMYIVLCFCEAVLLFPSLLSLTFNFNYH